MKKHISTPLILHKTPVIACFIFSLLICCCIATVAQNPSGNRTTGPVFNIKGKVVDQSGKGLAGATVTEKGRADNATFTTTDGSFSLNVHKQESVLVFSHIGFQLNEVSVNGANSSLAAVSLSPVASSLDDVVVVGYGTQKKTTVTGAVSSVKGAELVKAPVPNITNSIVGRVSGVIGRQAGGGQPGNDNTSFSIRGISTTGNNAPLIVVDNVIRNNINQVDPNSIESVTILKDAAATAPYGLGGANGVVLITTKQGKTGAPTISVNTWYGIQAPTFYPEVLSAQDYMRLRNEAYFNENPTLTVPLFDKTRIDDYLNLNKQDPDKNPIATPKDIVNFHAPMQSHNVQVSGGTERVKYYTNLGYFDQKGSFDQITYTRYNYSMNMEARVTNSTTFSVSMNGSLEKNRNLDPQQSAYNLLRATYKYIPIDPYKFSNGLWSASAGLSPYATLKSGGYSKQYNNTLLSTVTVDQKLPIKGLSIKGSFSYDPFTQSTKQYHKPYYYYTINTNATPYTYTKVASTAEGLVAYTYLSQSDLRNQQFTYQGYINYHNTFGKHDISGLFVAEARNNTSANYNARINNFALDVDEFNFGSSNRNDYSIGGSSSTGSQVGYVYRVTDAINGKYIIEASGRYDGHYYFAPGKRYAYFPSFSLGWVASQEKFMQGATWLNLLKVRGSWGKSGNLAGNAFQYINAYSLGGNAYAFGNGTLVQGTSPTNQANPNITWEQAIKTDIGFESRMFNDLLRLEVDLYKQKRSGMLFSPTTTVPAEYGSGLSQLNIGEMQSSGIEVTLGSSHRFGNGLMVNIDGTFSYASNKTIKIFETAATYNNLNRRRTGRPLNSQFGYKSLGLFQKSDDKNNDGIINATDGYAITQFSVLHPGDIKYADLSGPNGKPDGKIDANDETYIGNSPLPLINYGFTLAANWKGFDVTVFFQGAAKSAVGTLGFLTQPFNVNNSNAGYEYFDNRWTPATPDAKYPRANQAPYSNNSQAADFWIKDASFLKLRTLTVGYTVPGSVMHALKIRSIRVFATGQNILTFSKINWIDPEVAGSGTGNTPGTGANPGAETIFPLQKSLTFGLNVTF